MFRILGWNIGNDHALPYKSFFHMPKKTHALTKEE